MGDIVPETLRRARALIERPGAWTQGAMMRGADGVSTIHTRKPAVCWCSDGALIEVATTESEYLEAAAGLRSVLPLRFGEPMHVAQWNDAHGRTHADVLAAFDRAIEAAENGGRRG